MKNFTFVDPRYTLEDLEFLPEFLSERDPAHAREQLHGNYSRGWHPNQKFVPHFDGPPESWTLSYPGDPDMRIIAYCILHDEETIAVFPHAFVAVKSPHHPIEITRMD